MTIGGKKEDKEFTEGDVGKTDVAIALCTEIDRVNGVEKLFLERLMDVGVFAQFTRSLAWTCTSWVI